MSPPTKPAYDLERFVSAQEPIFEHALAELKAGQKRSHWMWFVFPQVSGLGSSSMAVRYAIGSKAEAEAYLAHPLLGPRLRACASALLDVEGKSVTEVMGQPDDAKLRSSMTLFAALSPPGSPFHAVLKRYFPEGPDESTKRFLSTAAS